MIEKMAYVNIAGRKEDLDRITQDYLSNYEMHIENALTRLEGQDFISSIPAADPYKDLIAKASEISQMIPKDEPEKKVSPSKARKAEKKLLKKFAGKEMSREEACSFITSTYDSLSSLRDRKGSLTAEKAGQD